MSANVTRNRFVDRTASRWLPMPNTCGPLRPLLCRDRVVDHDAQPMPIEVEHPTDVLEQPAPEAIRPPGTREKNRRNASWWRCP
jgi:hypothetical protein